MYIRAFEHVIEGFKEWIVTQGGVIKANTSEWEVLRFDINDQMRIIYKNKRGALTFTHHADVYLYSYLKNSKLGRIRTTLLGELPRPSLERKWDSGIWS